MTLEPPRDGWHEDSGFTGRPFWDISADGREESKLFLNFFFFFALPGNPSLPGAQQPNSSWNWGWEFLWLFGKGQSLDSFKPGGKKNQKKPPIKRDLQFQEGCSGKNISRGIHSAGGLCTELSNSTRYTPGKKMGILLQRCFQQGCGGSRKG